MVVPPKPQHQKKNNMIGNILLSTVEAGGSNLAGQMLNAAVNSQIHGRGGASMGRGECCAVKTVEGLRAFLPAKIRQVCKDSSLDEYSTNLVLAAIETMPLSTGADSRALYREAMILPPQASPAHSRSPQLPAAARTVPSPPPPTADLPPQRPKMICPTCNSRISADNYPRHCSSGKCARAQEQARRLEAARELAERGGD